MGTDHALPLSELSEEGADEVVLGISVAELLDNTMECSGRKMWGLVTTHVSQRILIRSFLFCKWVSIAESVPLCGLSWSLPQL